jgi:hypothetical protein
LNKNLCINSIKCGNNINHLVKTWKFKNHYQEQLKVITPKIYTISTIILILIIKISVEGKIIHLNSLITINTNIHILYQIMLNVYLSH